MHQTNHSATERNVLYSDDEFRIEYVPHQSTDLVITFSRWHQKYPQSDGFGHKFLSERGISSLHFIAESNNWWQLNNLEKALNIETTREIIESHRHRIGYGSSMGAYGLLLWSKLLRLDRAILFSPQFSCDLSKIPNCDSWLESQIRHVKIINDDLYTSIRRDSEFTVIYDPRSQTDAWHAAQLTELQNCSFILCPFSGHPTIEFLSRTGLLQPLLVSYFSNGIINNVWRDQIRKRRSSDQVYMQNRVKARANIISSRIKAHPVS